MPTVLIAVHQGFAARYLLRTQVMRGLLAAGCEVVVLTPNAGEEYLEREFDDPRVTIEPLRADIDGATGVKGWSLLVTLRHYTLAGVHRSPALLEKYEGFRMRTRRDGRRLLAACFHLALNVLWRSRTARRTLLAVESRLVAEMHADVFERHRPDLVVTSSPGWFFPDAVVLREAQRRGIKTATVVLSWDNPTSKGYRGAMPDLVVCWSERMARQVIEHHDVPAARVRVEGVPHFDHYAIPGALPSREEVFAQFGLDAARRLVVFATGSPGSFRGSIAVARALHEGLPEAELVVRLHPLSFRPDYAPALAEWDELEASTPHLRVDRPLINSTVLRCDMDPSDAPKLGGLIAHCDVLVNAFSTTTLEAFLCDRPVVLVTSDVGEAAVPDVVASHRDFEGYEHIAELVGSGAAAIARSLDEAVALAREALADPDAGSQARRRIAALECGPTDGHAGERIAAALLELVGPARTG